MNQALQRDVSQMNRQIRSLQNQEFFFKNLPKNILDIKFIIYVEYFLKNVSKLQIHKSQPSPNALQPFPQPFLQYPQNQPFAIDYSKHDKNLTKVSFKLASTYLSSS